MIDLQRLARQIAVCALLGSPGLPAAALVNYDVTVTLVTSEGGNSLSSPASPNGQAVINFFPQDNSTLLCQPTGASVVPIVRMLTYAGTERAEKDPFDGTFTVSLKILNNDQGGDATASFTGRLTGYVSQGESVLSTTWNEPRTRAVVVNGTTFTVTIGPFIAPGAPITNNQGLIGATITCASTGTAVSSVSLPAGPLKAGQAVQGTITLNNPAPVGGAVVALTSGAPSSLALPASVIIPEGAASATFIGAAQAVGTNVSVQAQWNNTTASKTVSIVAGGSGGDTNGDGVVTIVDVARWLRAVSGLDTMPG